MAWIFDTYSMNKGHSVLGVVTGKPLTIGGSLGREEATARGALYCIRDAVAKRDERLEGMTVAVQGFGNVGSQLAKLLHEEGAIVVGISDSTVALHNPKGIDVPAAVAHKREHGTLRGLKDAEEIGEEDLLLLDVDILAPCALEQVITELNADRVKASIICEGANGPVTPSADAILEEKGVLILPDVLANAGGVVVSYFEWVQGLQEYFWKETEVNAKLNDIMSRAFEETWGTAEQRQLPMRVAAYGLAVQRVAEATITRGIYPGGNGRFPHGFPATRDLGSASVYVRCIRGRGRRLPRGGVPSLRKGARAGARAARGARVRAAGGRHHRRPRARSGLSRVAAGRRDRRAEAVHLSHTAGSVPPCGCTSDGRVVAAKRNRLLQARAEEDVWRIA
jgi:hypothetical protein